MNRIVPGSHAGGRSRATSKRVSWAGSAGVGALTRQPSLHVDPSVADSVMDDIAAAQRDFAV